MFAQSLSRELRAGSDLRDATPSRACHGPGVYGFVNAAVVWWSPLGEATAPSRDSQGFGEAPVQPPANLSTSSLCKRPCLTCATLDGCLRRGPSSRTLSWYVSGPIHGRGKRLMCVQRTWPVVLTVYGPRPTVQVSRPAPSRLHRRYHGTRTVPTAPWVHTPPTAPATGPQGPPRSTVNPWLPRLPSTHGHPRSYRPLVYHGACGTHGTTVSYGSHGYLALRWS